MVDVSEPLQTAISEVSTHWPKCCVCRQVGLERSNSRRCPAAFGNGAISVPAPWASVVLELPKQVCSTVRATATDSETIIHNANTVTAAAAAAASNNPS